MHGCVRPVSARFQPAVTLRANVFPKAAIATPHYLATGAGLGVLLQGGNAVDAAIAANLVLAVVCPHLCGAGGDLMAMVYAGGEIIGLNSTGRLPAAAELPENNQVPTRGIQSANVPGAVAGWTELAGRFGTISIKELAQRAILYAREGFPVSPSLARGIERGGDNLDAEARRIFLAGAWIKNPDLADTLENLDEFYTGGVARSAPPPFAPWDFASHKAEWVNPLHAPFQDTVVYEMPPNSRGYLALEAIERLESLEGLGEDDPEFHLRMVRALEPGQLTGDTVYLCAMDEKGMAVSINESNYMGFGSGVVIPGTGVHLNNRAAYFTPDTYRGGNKPVHTLSPAMALTEGAPKMIFGTMGGDAQVQIHLQLLARILILGQDPAEAVAAPRWIRHGAGELMAEEGLPEIGAQTIPALNDLAGHAHVILTTPKGLVAASDPRCDGLAAGY